MVVGAFPQELYKTGEAAHERLMRSAYAAPGPDSKTLSLRLRA